MAAANFQSFCFGSGQFRSVCTITGRLASLTSVPDASMRSIPSMGDPEIEDQQS